MDAAGVGRLSSGFLIRSSKTGRERLQSPNGRLAGPKARQTGSLPASFAAGFRPQNIGRIASTSLCCTALLIVDCGKRARRSARRLVPYSTSIFASTFSPKNGVSRGLNISVKRGLVRGIERGKQGGYLLRGEAFKGPLAIGGVVILTLEFIHRGTQEIAVGTG